jgi:hypothetical protein
VTASLCPSPPKDLLAEWANLIRSEYSEMPGLSLNRRQVVRLWQLDRPLADALLEHLVGEGFLRCTPTGSYIRTEVGRC